jgi:hypothetical protein
MITHTSLLALSHFKKAQKKDISNLNPYELNDFCEVVAPNEIYIHAKF